MALTPQQLDSFPIPPSPVMPLLRLTGSNVTVFWTVSEAGYSLEANAGLVSTGWIFIASVLQG